MLSQPSRVRYFSRALALCALLLLADCAQTCTGIRVRPKDGACITGRTLEFGYPLRSDIIVIPRGKEYTGSAPGGKKGLKWLTKYGAVGMSALDLPQIADGLNEKGLGVGLFYFPGFAKYQEVSDADASKALAPWELGTYLLTTCADVDEAVKAAKDCLVGPTVLEEWKFSPPAHYVLHDASGKCKVLEYVAGKLNVHDNPFGVMSNAPTFDWHMTNLRNYVNLSFTSSPPLDLDRFKLAPLGQGSGMLGLPGDFTPPSRFVRAVAFSLSILPVEKAEDGVKQTFHVLNQFDLPKGAAREKEGKDSSDYTEWTSVSDLTNRRFYVRTYDNQRIRMVQLSRCKLDAKDVRIIRMAGKEVIEDVTD